MTPEQDIAGLIGRRLDALSDAVAVAAVPVLRTAADAGRLFIATQVPTP